MIKPAPMTEVSAALAHMLKNSTETLETFAGHFVAAGSRLALLNPGDKKQIVVTLTHNGLGGFAIEMETLPDNKKGMEN